MQTILRRVIQNRTIRTAAIIAPHFLKIYLRFINTMAYYKGWRYVAFLTGFVGFIGVTLYPIIISPMMDSSEYKKIQKVARKNIRQEDIQPGNMKVWSDPFDRKKPESE
ncbi:unnamed protein product [Chilo suppressalis]|uniref:Small integral membrane protein 20 n=1 Tax=Chilo suppressalis TaxID=168631 RepID=A0ABN8ARB1_CHISP|nr:hypothetical protein evm_014160 [Chilo suppressalis]CAH0397143.1 unnamed protein product [Chilo suppressalis]